MNTIELTKISLSGCKCSFKSLGDGTGEKRYKSIHHAHEAFFAQKEFYELGLAPKPIKLEGSIVITEEVQRLCGKINPNDLYDFDSKLYQKISNKWYPKISNFTNKVFNEHKELAKKHFWLLNDNHIGNFGIKKGQILLIDFS